MSAFPSSWEFATETAGTASIVVPAAGPNIRRILTYIDAYVLNLGLGGASPALQVLDGGTTIFSRTLRTNAVAGAEDSNEFDKTVLLMGSPATTMTVRFSAAVSLEALLIQGYDL